MHQVRVDTPAVNDTGWVFSFSPDGTLNFLIGGFVAPALQVISRFLFDGSFFHVLGGYGWLNGFMAELLKG